MNATKRIEIYGGFHNQMRPIVVRATVSENGIELSKNQARRIRNHMCGIKDCMCGMHHGWVVEGSDRGELSEAIAIAENR